MKSYTSPLKFVAAICKRATDGPWHIIEPGPEDSFGDVQVHAKYTGKVYGAVVEVAVMRQEGTADAELLMTARDLMGSFTEALQHVNKLADDCVDDDDAGIRLVGKSLQTILRGALKIKEKD